jgi:hypothetical protein
VLRLNASLARFKVARPEPDVLNLCSEPVKYKRSLGFGPDASSQESTIFDKQARTWTNAAETTCEILRSSVESGRQPCNVDASTTGTSAMWFENSRALVRPYGVRTISIGQRCMPYSRTS